MQTHPTLSWLALTSVALTSLVLLAACEDPAESAPAATVEAPEATEEAGEESAEPGEEAGEAGAALSLDAEQSSLGFVGSKVTDSHEGRFETFTGAITLDAAGEAIAAVEITIEMASVVADSERLTGHLKTPDFFAVEEFPQATFVSTGMSPAPADTEDANTIVAGRLTLHGQERAITFPAQIDVSDDSVRARARFSIDRQDFGIAYAGMADDLIRDDVVIHFDVRAPRS